MQPMMVPRMFVPAIPPTYITSVAHSATAIVAAFVQFMTVAVLSPTLFAIYTGLRRSDILALDWRNLHLRSKKNAYMTLIIHKTQNKVRLPLSESTVKLLGKPLKEGVVFNGLTEHALNKYVPILIKTAGISKHITFHRFRICIIFLHYNLSVAIISVYRLIVSILQWRQTCLLFEEAAHIR